MTPEQEDAHWALQGKPLMREWRAYCRVLGDYHEYNRKARIHRGVGGDTTTALILEGYAKEARDAALAIWRRCGFTYEPFGAVADGVYYARAEGESNDT